MDGALRAASAAKMGPEAAPNPEPAEPAPEARTAALAARAGFVLVGLLPWIVPLLRAALPLGAIGVALDASFATMCHRLPERSLVLAGVTMPLCSRCAGIFAGIALGAVLARPALSMRAWRIAITATAGAMVVDVATQDLGLHPVWHATRLATGIAFGYALAAACVRALSRMDQRR